MNKTLIILSIGRFLQIIILFVTSRIMTKLLSHEEVGFLYLLLSLSSYIGLVLMNPVGVYFTRRLHDWAEQKTIVNAFLLFCVYTFFTSLLSFPLIYIGKYFIGLNGHYWLSLSFLMSFYVFSTTVNNTIIPSLNILKYRVEFIILTFLTQLIALICSYLLVLKDNSSFYWLTGQAISFFIWFIVAFLFFRIKHEESVSLKVVKKSIAVENRKKFLSFVFPIVITNISLWILNQSYRPIIERTIGLEFLGYIGLGFGLATSLSVAFEYLLQQFYYPDFYKNITGQNKKTREREWNRIFNKMIPLLLFMCFFISINSSFIIRVLADEKFWGAWIYISFGMCIEFFRMLNNVLGLIAQSEMKTKKTILPYFIGGIVSALLVVHFSSGNYKLYVPLSIILGNILVFLLMRYNMGSFFTISFPCKNISIVSILSIPFLLVLPFKNEFVSYGSTITILTISSLYFMGVGLFLFNKLENEQYE